MAKIARKVSEHSLETMTKDISETLEVAALIEVVAISWPGGKTLFYRLILSYKEEHHKLERFETWKQLTDYYRTLMAMERS